MVPEAQTRETSRPSGLATAAGLFIRDERPSLGTWKPKYSQIVPVLIGEYILMVFWWTPGSTGTLVEP